MFMRMNSVAAALLASAFFGITSAQAALVSYSDAASWNSAVPSKTTVTIPEPPNAPDGSVPGYLFLNDSASFGGVTFSVDPNAGNFFQICTAFPADTTVFVPVLSFQTVTPGVQTLAEILITFAAPVKAFSLNFGTFDGEQVNFQLSTGDQFGSPSTGGSYAVPGFVGITSSTAFNTVLVSSTDEALNLNNLSFDSPISAVPETSTWAMMLLGFAGVAWLGSRRLRKSHLRTA